MHSFSNFLVENKKTGVIINAEDHPEYKHRTGPNTPLHSPEEVKKALESDAASRRIIAKKDTPKEGDLVGARLNLNVRRNTGVPVVTLHKGTNSGGHTKNKGFFHGNARSYHHVATLHNAYFNVNQQGRHDIATKKESKHPMASVDGEFKPNEKPNFDGVEARFNPMRHHLFVDPHGNAIRSAEHATLHGDRVYMRGKIEYHTPETAPAKVGGDEAPSEVKFRQG